MGRMIGDALEAYRAEGKVIELQKTLENVYGDEPTLKELDEPAMKAIIWKDESLGAEFEIVDIPTDLKDQAEEYHSKLIETAVEADDDAMEAYLEGNEPDEAGIKALIRKGTIDQVFVPVLCGTAFKNKGVQPLLDAVVDFMKRWKPRARGRVGRIQKPFSQITIVVREQGAETSGEAA